MIIGTKKDQFWNMHYGEAVQSRDQFADENALKEHCDMMLRERMFQIEDEQRAIKGGRCDAIAAVSRSK